MYAMPSAISFVYNVYSRSETTLLLIHVYYVLYTTFQMAAKIVWRAQILWQYRRSDGQPSRFDWYMYIYIYKYTYK